MYLLDKNKARSILLAQNFLSDEVDRMLKHYPALPDPLGDLIDRWLVDQNIPDFEVDNISLKDVIERRHSHFLIAIRDLGRLLDSDLTPEKREQWRRILSTPIHYE